MTFLATLANKLLNTYGSDLSQVTVVFPNKRPALFLNEELTLRAGRNLRSPAYITISDLFRSLSSWEEADPIKLVCDLHKSFVHCTGINYSLDHFYSWGEILLADFDDVDKHMAPAEKVFANLRNIHEFDDDTYLTQQQKEIIRKFFSNFNEEHNTELKQRFISLWSHLYDIYIDFNERLAKQGLAYEGALYRQVIEKSSERNANASFDQRENSSPQIYIFAGFYLLQPVEQALIHRLESEGKASLIQDTDEETPKDITFISTLTNNSQARYVSTWLEENNRIEAGRKTAIVLADESLLQSVIHCIPNEVNKVNITIGYPLSQTASAAQGMSQDVLVSPKSPLESEALYRLQQILNRLHALIDSGDLQVEPATLHRLLTQIIASTTIPFHGEPIEGVQIMGILETRNIDFDHVLLLSCNEGNIPKGVNDTSFIPYSIRKAYNLTTIDHKVAIYHNYFRRLLQRAGDVTLLYNNATTDGKTGEMSQFMLQLLVESPHPITRKTLQTGQQPILHQPRPVTKTEAVMQRLQHLGTLSPSALARYLRCPLQFFYHYVAKLEEYKEEDERIDNRIFGNIFHKAAQALYASYSPSSPLTYSLLDAILKDKSRIARAVDQAIKLELFHIEDPMAQMQPLTGLQLIKREVIIRYICQLLEVDCRIAPFTILALEQKLTLPSLLLTPSLSISGIADRIDKITLPDGTERIRIIDYKTGSSRLKPLPDIAAIFDPANIRHHSDYYLQTLLYAIISQGQWAGTVSPCLLFIQHASTDNYDPTLVIGKTPITDINEVKDEFLHHLKNLLNEIFDQSKPFLPTEEKTRCKTCPFKKLCE